MYPKDELLQMIIETDRKGKMLQNASPMINVSEAIHGTYSAHMVHNTANLPTVPLGNLNDDHAAYGIALGHTQEAELNRQMNQESNGLIP